MGQGRPRVTEGLVTHPFIEGFTLPQENDISLDEIRIERLHDAQNNISAGGKIIKYTEMECTALEREI